MNLWGIVKGLLVRDETDKTKELSIEIDPTATTGTRTTVKSTQTTDRTVNLPDADDTLVGKQTNDVLENKTIDFTAATGNNSLSADASDISYNNSVSGLTATQTQDAIDEVEGRVDVIETTLPNKADIDLNNLSTTAINTDLNPETDNSIDLGTSLLRYAQAFVQSIFTPLVKTLDNSTVDANPTDSLEIKTGDKTAGTGDSGDIIIQPGTSVGGSRGKLLLSDGSEGTVGHIWTSTDVNGRGNWAPNVHTDIGNFVFVDDTMSISTTNADMFIQQNGTGSINFLTSEIIKFSDNHNSDWWGGNIEGVFFDSTQIKASVTGNDAVFIQTTDIASAIGNEPDFYILTGSNTVSSTGATGQLYIGTGDHFDSGSSGRTGNVTLISGYNAGSGTSGDMYFESGGTGSGGGNTGPVFVRSGQAQIGNSGKVTVTSGRGAGIASNSGILELLTGITSNGNSGGIFIKPGIPSGTGNRGLIYLQDGSEGTAGHVWTSTGINGEGQWQAASPSGDAWSDPVDSNIIPDTTGAYNLGSSGLQFGTTYTQGMEMYLDGAYLYMDSLGGRYTQLFTGNTAVDYGGNFNIFNALEFADDSTIINYGGRLDIFTHPSGGASGDLYVGSGDSGINNSGNLILRTGTSSATRGDILIQDGSEGTIGHVWTSTGVSGEGSWAPVSSGANTTLSNLTSPTAVNQDILPGLSFTYDLGSPSAIWNQVHQRWGYFRSSMYLENTGVITTQFDRSASLDYQGSAANGFVLQTNDGISQAYKTESQTVASTNSGSIGIRTGDVSGATSDSGNIVLQTGTATQTRGSIKLIDGSEGNIGDVWKSTGINGEGQWSSQSVNLNVTSVSALYNSTSSDDVILCDASGGAFTVNLFSAVGNNGKVLTIKKTDSSFNQVTIDPNSTETIDLVSTRSLSTDGETIKIISDGSNWHILDWKYNESWFAFTGSGSWINDVSYAAIWKREGINMRVQYKVSVIGGALTAAALTLDLPSGALVKTSGVFANFANTQNWTLGKHNVHDLGTNNLSSGYRVAYNNTSSVKLMYDPNTQVSNTQPITFVNGDEIFVEFLVPISGWDHK